MPMRRTVTSAVLLSTFALGACVSNNAPQSRDQRNANIRSGGSPDAQPMPPLQADAPDRDPGSRYLPVAQPLGQVPVESPPFVPLADPNRP